MQVVLLVAKHRVVSRNVSTKKCNSGKSGRKVEIKKNTFKEKGRQSQLYTQLEKVHKKPNLVILKAMFHKIKSLKIFVGSKMKIQTLQEINASRIIMVIWLLIANENQLLGKVTMKHFLMLSSPGIVAPCLKNNYPNVLQLGLPPKWLAKHWQR